MKKIICLIIASVFSISAGSVSAEQVIREKEPYDDTVYPVTAGSGSCGDEMNWELNSSGVMHISGTGNMRDYYTEFETDVRKAESDGASAENTPVWTDYYPWFKNNNPRAITSIIIDEGINSVSESAFGGTNVSALIIPDSVRELGMGAFSGSQSLKGLVLPDSMETVPKAFAACESLEYVHLPNKASVISQDAFYGSYSLKHIYLPNSIKEIGLGAFENCAALDEIILPDNLEKIDELAFAFCDNLKKVSFPKGLKEIGKDAFTGCYSLSEIYIPDGTEKIGRSAFAVEDKNKISGIRTVYIPQSVTSIDKYAFNSEDVIYGFKNSAAESFAKENGNKFVAVTESMYIAPTNINNNIDVLNDGNIINVSAAGKNIKWVDAQPFIDENGRTQIPVRAVAEAMGAKVDWDNDTNTATVTKDGTTVTITIGDVNMSVGNKTVTMDTSAQIIDERTYIPVRFVGEALGMTVNWIGE